MSNEPKRTPILKFPSRDQAGSSVQTVLPTCSVAKDGIEGEHACFDEYGSDFRDLLLSKHHASGWIISANIHADHYTCVSDFEATHETLGRVWGNFNGEVCATSKEAYAHFCENHPTDTMDWDDV